MNMLTALLGRILAGERYKRASKEDSRIWVSLLAAFPFPLIVSFLTASLMNNAALMWIWLSLVVLLAAFGGLWLFLYRTFQLRGLGIIAGGTWLCAFAAAFTLP